MGRGTRYQHVETILREHSAKKGGNVLQGQYIELM